MYAYFIPSIIMKIKKCKCCTLMLIQWIKLNLVVRAAAMWLLHVLIFICLARPWVYSANFIPVSKRPFTMKHGCFSNEYEWTYTKSVNAIIRKNIRRRTFKWWIKVKWQKIKRISKGWLQVQFKWYCCRRFVQFIFYPLQLYDYCFIKYCLLYRDL